MKISETAQKALVKLLEENPGKSLRVVFQGFG